MATKRLLVGAIDIGLTASYDTGTLPTDGDDMLIATAGEDITAGNTALSAVDLLSLTISQAVKRNYGTAANPMQHIIDRTGTGKLNLFGQSEVVAIGGGVINEVIMAPGNGAQVFYCSATSVPIFRQYAAVAKIAGTCALSLLDIVGGSMDIVKHGTNTITGGGRIEGGALVYLRRRIASAALHVSGDRSRLVYDVDTSTTTPEGKIGAGATVEARAGAMTLDLTAGGILDLRKLADTYTFIVKTTRKSRILLGNINATITETKVDGIGAKKE